MEQSIITSLPQGVISHFFPAMHEVVQQKQGLVEEKKGVMKAGLK